MAPLVNKARLMNMSKRGRDFKARGPLVWLPRWSQLAGRLPDGQPDPQAANDCGETCAAMYIAAAQGVAVEPGELRQYLHGDYGSGLTTGQDLVTILRHYNVKAECYNLDASAAMAVIKMHWGLALPCIILGYWNPPGGSLHWCIVEAYNQKGVTVINPWTASEYSIPFLTFARQFQSTIVTGATYLHYDMSKEPTPGS